MVKVKINDDEMYMDGYLQKNLDDLKEAIKLKWDGVGLYCGYEGDGKSVKAAQDCYYMDQTFNLDRCVFTPKQFSEAVKKAENGQAILFDEAHAAFNARKWQDAGQQAIISMLTRIRKKQLFIAIVSPTFFDITKYISIHRTRYLIWVRAEGLKRGRFSFFSRNSKHKLYVLGKKTENMNSCKPNFWGVFTGFFPFNEEEYNKKKDAAEEEMNKVEVKTNRYDEKRWEWFKGLVKSIKAYYNLNARQIRDLINERSKETITDRTIQKILANTDTHGVS